MIFFLIFLIVPFIEISLFIKVGSEIGIWNTILLCIVNAVIGAILVRIQGVNTLLALQAQMRKGEMPLQQIFDGLCITVAGALLVVPGFFTDVIGFSLLVPWVRKMLRAFMISSMGLSEVSNRMAAGRTKDGEDVIDGEFTRVDQDRLPR